MEDKKALKYIITNTEVSNLCEECSCKVESIFKNEGDERLDRLKTLNLKEGLLALGCQMSEDLNSRNDENGQGNNILGERNKVIIVS
jgi:hypothetical protein